ncbi:Protein unc-79 [Nymphon striatum]|nr:Protein unc-79 [Nymphon striatum]
MVGLEEVNVYYINPFPTFDFLPCSIGSKIRHINDYCTRIEQGLQPPPSESDMCNTLKHFSQTLLGVLKDVPTISIEVMKNREKDHSRMSIIPNMNYKGLYTALVRFLDTTHLIQTGLQAIGHSIIYTLICLVPFLEHEYMDTLPYLVASSMAYFPETVHKYIIDVLCTHLLPFTISVTKDTENPNYATLSTSAILMMTFQYTNDTSYHCQMMECLMMLKRDVLKDLFCVIAHGTPDARAPAAHLLFYYWPDLNPASGDRKVASQIKHTVWEMFKCQRKNCSSANNQAVKMCLDHPVVIGPGDLNPPPPPLFICQGCCDFIVKEYKPEYILDFLSPIEHMSHTCENKNCRSSEKTSVCTCFSLECASYNGNKPIRYCAQCNSIRHNNKRGTDHIVHAQVPSPWTVDCEMQSYMIEAIISLLKEAQPVSEKMYGEGAEKSIVEDEDEDSELLKLEERRLLSRYGVWLMVGLCTPTEETPIETLGRLLAMLFEWFYSTACLIDDRAGDILEKLKTENIRGWIRKIQQSHFEVCVSCMFPYPVNYARVGSHWGNHMSETESLKEGFKRLLCLVPYDIVTVEVWNYIMPYWMEAVRTEISENDLSEFQVLFSKVFDVDMSPLGFDASQMYQFISNKFTELSIDAHEKALLWLQNLTALEVFLPLDLLFTMYTTSVTTLSKVKVDEKFQVTMEDGTQTPVVDDDETNLSCFMEVQEIPPHCGLETSEAKDTLNLIRDLVKVTWLGNHTCDSKKINKPVQCEACELGSVWYQICMGLLEYLCPIMERPVQEVEIFEETPEKVSENDTEPAKPEGISMKELEEKLNNVDLSSETSEGPKNEVGEINVAKVMTALEVCEPEPLDTVAMMPTEEVVTAFARAVTLTETDVAIGKHWQALASIGKHWQASASIGKHRQALASIGKHWQASASIGKHWQALASIGKHWQALASIGKHWQALASIGKHWQALASIGKHWQALASIGKHWQALASIGKHWQALASIGKHWQALASIGKHWQALASIGKHWQALASIGKHWQALASIGKHWQALASIGKHWQALASIGKHWQALASIGKHWQALASIGKHWQALASIGKHWQALASVALAKCTVASATLVDENDQAVSKDQEDDASFWHTSQGKFKYTIEELPPHLQLIHALLKNMNNYSDPDITSYLLSTLRLMCLHAEVLSKAAKDHRGFLIWTQENLLVPNLWKVLSPKYSHISQIATSLLLHALTLPSGADTFLDKVTSISRFLESVLVKNVPSVQSSVATAFVYLIRSLDDVNAMVSQKTLLYIETIKTSSIKLLCGTLEAQFDTVIVDRPMILQTIYQLYNNLTTVKFLTWDFFLGRFDALFLEAQIKLERSGDIAYPRDLKNTSMTSELFIRKLQRAQEALSTVTDSHRSLISSFGTKWPYKRALSAPAGMILKSDKIEKAEKDKEKVYSRQCSAPLLKRKSSRFSGGFHFPNHLFPDGNIKEQKEDDMLFLFLIPKIMEMEDSDKETMHLLIFLLMQVSQIGDGEISILKAFAVVFLANQPEHAYISDEKGPMKVQGIVVKHFTALLGYSASERGFFIPPSKLRISPVFNACISSLPKYRYSNPPFSKSIQTLIHIVLNTLEAQHHRCKNKFDSYIMGSSYVSHSRELSSVSIDMEPSPSHTPPTSAPDQNSRVKITSPNNGHRDRDDHFDLKEDIGFVLGNSVEISKQSRDKYDRQQWKSRKYVDYSYSSDADDIEPELEAIPESPKSDSSSQETSMAGSVVDLADLRSTITVETARVRVERPNSSSDEEGLVILNPSVEIVEQPTVVLDPTAKVECHMEHQIQAFERSWVSSSSENGNDVLFQDVSTFSSPEERSECRVISTHPTVYQDDTSIHMPIRSTTAEVKSGPSVTLERALHSHMIKTDNRDFPARAQLVRPTIVRAEPYGPVTELQEIKVISHEEAATLGARNITMKGKEVQKINNVTSNPESVKGKLEVLDASHLEKSVCKTEPAVVKQVEHISTSHGSSGIKTQKYAMKTYEVPSTSFSNTQNKEPKPFTINIPPSTKSESIQTISCQERLLPVGPSCVRRDVKVTKDPEPQFQGNYVEVGTQVTENQFKLDSKLQNMPPITSAIVRHSVNPVIQSVSCQALKDPSVSNSFQYPSQERLLPVGMSPKSRGSPVTPTKRWKLMVHDIDIGEESKGNVSGPFTAETQMVYPPLQMKAKMKNLDMENSPFEEDWNESVPIKVDAKIYQGPTKGETRVKSGARTKSGKNISQGNVRNSNYAVIEPQHYFMEHENFTEISRHNFTKNLQSALEELHQNQDSPGDSDDGDDEVSNSDEPSQESAKSLLTEQTRDEIKTSCVNVEENKFETCRIDAGREETVIDVEPVEKSGSNPGKIHAGQDHIHQKLERISSDELSGETTELVSIQIGPCIKDLQPMFSEESDYVSEKENNFKCLKSQSSSANTFDISAQCIEVSPIVVNPTIIDNNLKVLKDPSFSCARSNAVVISQAQVIGDTRLEHLKECKRVTVMSKFAGEVCHMEPILMEESVIDLESKLICVQPQMETMVAMESPPNEIRRIQHSEVTDKTVIRSVDSSSDEAPNEDIPIRNIYKQRKQRKSGMGTLENQKSIEARKNQKQSEGGIRGSGQAVYGGGGGAPSKRSSTTQISGNMRSDDIVHERCMECGCVLEQYSDEELGLCIAVLGTFINREPGLAAPLLPDILKTVAKNMHLPGSCSSAAKQFLRCTLHQLAPNGLFSQIFQTNFEDQEFFKTIAAALSDFNDLNQMAPLHMLLESLNSGKCLPLAKLQQILENVADYLEHLPSESCGSMWCNLLPLFDSFLRKLVLCIPQTVDITNALRIMSSLLKVPAINSCKSILDPFSKLLSYALQNCSFKFQYLLDICHLCNRTFNRERDKLLLTRTVIYELVQAFKFKTSLPDHNLLMLVQLYYDLSNCFEFHIGLKDMIRQVDEDGDNKISFREFLLMFHKAKLGEFAIDSGLGALANLTEIDVDEAGVKGAKTFFEAKIEEQTNSKKFKDEIKNEQEERRVQEADKFVLQDAGGSLSHSIITGEMLNSQNSIQNLINTSASDCMRSHLTDALDFVADVHTLSKLQTNIHRTAVSLNEETLGGQLKAGIAQYIALDITKGNSRDNRALSRYLPWLFNPPSSLQQGPKEFTDCVAHIRLLSWLLLGALMHSSISPPNSTIQCQPISLEVNQHIADHIQVVLAGFAEQPKLWTMYNEHLSSMNPSGSEQSQAPTLTITDFWTKVTPGIIQLISHSEGLAEMVNLHFLSLMEALLECNSTIFAKLLPMWIPVLQGYKGQLPSHLQVRLRACLIQRTPIQSEEATTLLDSAFHKWLKKLQFKMGQIELQWSTAIQFYTV